MCSALKLTWKMAAALVAAALSTPLAHGEPTTFGYAEFITLIESRQPSTPLQLLNALPQSLRENHLLLHHTQSQDEASVKFPRIVLFNEDASLLLAFSGSAAHSRGAFVEVIHFNKTDRTFEPVEIAFSETSPPRIRVRPQECFACHGPKEFRPIWRAYDTWPGALGVRHVQQSVPSLRDAWAYREFRAHTRHIGHERYRELPLSKSVNGLGESNSQFTALLATPNAERIAQLIIDKSGRDPQRIVPILIALNGGPFRDFARVLPKKHAEIFKLSLDEIKTEVRAKLMDDFHAKTALTNAIHGSTWPFPKKATAFEVSFENSQIMLRFLEQHEYIGPLDEWPTTARGRSLEYSQPHGSFFSMVAGAVFRGTRDNSGIHAMMSELGIMVPHAWFDFSACETALTSNQSR